MNFRLNYLLFTSNFLCGVSSSYVFQNPAFNTISNAYHVFLRNPPNPPVGAVGGGDSVAIFRKLIFNLGT